MTRQFSEQSLNNRADPPDKDGDTGARPAGPDRLAREAEALRANLRRRKAQARARRDAAAADSAAPPESPAGSDPQTEPEDGADRPGRPIPDPDAGSFGRSGSDTGG